MRFWKRTARRHGSNGIRHIASGAIRVLTNFYSVPLAVGVEVQAKVYSTYVEIWHQGQYVARHELCFDRQQKILDVEHYLEALTKKPGALAGSTPLEQWRAQGRWPVSFDHFLGDVEAKARPAVGNTRDDRCSASGPPVWIPIAKNSD
jgi:Mu transposase, C-terminal domain